MKVDPLKKNQRPSTNQVKVLQVLQDKVWKTARQILDMLLHDTHNTGGSHSHILRNLKSLLRRGFVLRKEVPMEREYYRHFNNIPHKDWKFTKRLKRNVLIWRITKEGLGYLQSIEEV